jgi:hypothetical protein
MNSITQAKRNIEMLTLIANKLEELCDEVTFVGGCIVGLLITDKAANCGRNITNHKRNKNLSCYRVFSTNKQSKFY